MQVLKNSSSDAVWWFLQELTSRVVAKTGIPSDRNHLGKLILQSFKDAPDFVMQIDGATGEKDTFESALDRSVRCATCFRNLGLKYQDLVIIMGLNHINLTIPIYAALYLGVIAAGIDMTLRVDELRHTFKICKPKVVFCQSSNAEVVQEALDFTMADVKIVVFDEKHGFLSFTEFLKSYDGDEKVENFKPEDFDPEETIGIMNPTSGSSGVPKAVGLTHRQMLMGYPLMMNSFLNFPTPCSLGFVISPVQWLTACVQFINSPIFRYTRLQSSSPLTIEHVYFLINKYKPDLTVMSPTFLIGLLKLEDRDKCDFSSFRLIYVGGSAVSKNLFLEMKNVSPDTYVKVFYGMTEATSLIFNAAYSPSGSVGIPYGHFQCKLVDTNTNEDIDEPNMPGELRIKGPAVTKGYYNDPENTAAAFDDKGWFKSGDLFYRDEYHNYYFVDRVKTLLKYKNHQISPVEVENVIRKHPGVLDVAVTGIPDYECGDLAVALVIPQKGKDVSAEEIKDLVKESLTDTKQLRGGVIFVEEFPTTSTSKVDRRKLQALAMSSKRH